MNIQHDKRTGPIPTKTIDFENVKPTARVEEHATGLYIINGRFVATWIDCDEDKATAKLGALVAKTRARIRRKERKLQAADDQYYRLKVARHVARSGAIEAFDILQARHPEEWRDIIHACHVNGGHVKLDPDTAAVVRQVRNSITTKVGVWPNFARKRWPTTFTRAIISPPTRSSR